MVCPHQIALCDLHKCTHCDHHGDEEHCPFGLQEAEDVTAPTFEVMLNVYRWAKPTRHVRQVCDSIVSDLERVGLSVKSRSSEMTRAKFKALISLLSAPMADGVKLRGTTIKSHIDAFRSITSEWLADKYEDAGIDLPAFSIPKFKIEKVPVQEVSDKTIRKVEIEMEKWLASGNPSDVSAYKFCFFALYCGMRAGDICSATWDILRNTTAGIMVVYKPHKTANSTGVTVSFPITNRTYCKIEPLIGEPGEYVIPRCSNRAPTGVKKTGEFVGMHVYLRNKVNRMLSECGIGNEYRGQKKAHALRKYFETDRAFMNGNKEAAEASGHTLSVQKRSYLGTLVGKVT